MIVNIIHPLADTISVQSSQYHYCTQGVSSEIAFFMKGEWVTDLIEPFSEYADAAMGDTRVYGWVPNNLLYAFIEENEDK
jgi:hypothetical protein